MSKENSLFKTDKVRDLISELYTAREAQKVPAIKAMDYSLYSDLGAFMDMVGQYDSVDKRNTLKNYLVGIICADNKYNSDQMKMQKIDAFIASVEAENKAENATMLEAMKKIKGKLSTMLTNSSPDKCKTEIVSILGNYFKTNTLTDQEILRHEELKKKVLAAPEKDRKLFLNFADFVKCDVSNNCDDPTVSTIETEGSRFNLRKKNGDEIILLELFSGSKDVSVVMTKNDLSMVEKITSWLWDYVLMISFTTGLVLGLYCYFKSKSTEATTPGTPTKPPELVSPSDKQERIKFAGFILCSLSIVYILFTQMGNIKNLISNIVSKIVSIGFANPFTTGLIIIAITGIGVYFKWFRLHKR